MLSADLLSDFLVYANHECSTIPSLVFYSTSVGHSTVALTTFHYRHACFCLSPQRLILSLAKAYLDCLLVPRPCHEQRWLKQEMNVSSVRETGPEQHCHSPALDVKNRRKGAKATAERSCGGNTQDALDPGQWQERCLLLYSTLFSVCGDVRNDKKTHGKGLDL